VSIRRILAALETTDLPANEKLLLILLADHADDETGKCWPSQNYIASRSGLARSTINRTIKRLEGKSLIRIKHRFREDGGNRSNTYIVMPGVRPPCAREAHPPVSQKHTEPVSNEPTYITTLSLGEINADIKQGKRKYYRKLSAVERAELATIRADERAQRASHGPHLATDDRSVRTPVDKRVGGRDKP